MRNRIRAAVRQRKGKSTGKWKSRIMAQIISFEKMKHKFDETHSKVGMLAEKCARRGYFSNSDEFFALNDMIDALDRMNNEGRQAIMKIREFELQQPYERETKRIVGAIRTTSGLRKNYEKALRFKPRKVVL
ncbi:MAG: hypothetical protein HYW05_05020 [Candidatus Diapherotrites archaeon]|nr:hypothetical protein [Candidatus Diapherotrites archaeon]